MAKNRMGRGDRKMPAVKAMELKKLLKAIVDEDFVDLEKVDRAQHILSALVESKLKKTAELKISHQETGPTAVPEEFKCPLSKEIMRDPVIVSTGQTYERDSIEKWLQSGKRTCPQTAQQLSYTTITSNHLVRDMITKWYQKINNDGIKLDDKNDGVKLNDEEAVSDAVKAQFQSSLEKMSASLPEQKEAAKELRQLTKKTPSSRVLFSQCDDALPRLIAPLSQRNTAIDEDFKEDIITAVMNISLEDKNKKMIAETPTLIPVLVNAVKSGTTEIRRNAAAAIYSLCTLDSNKSLIAKLDALKPLFLLLDEGHHLAMRDAAYAIFSLCLLHENKVRAVEDGAVGVILKKIKDGMQVDELVSILAMLSTNQKAIQQMLKLSAVPCLLHVMKETSTARIKENCIAILYTLCSCDQATWRKLREEEEKYHTISQLAKDGTSKAKIKAEGILDRLMNSAKVTHTA